MFARSTTNWEFLLVAPPPAMHWSIIWCSMRSYALVENPCLRRAASRGFPPEHIKNDVSAQAGNSEVISKTLSPDLVGRLTTIRRQVFLGRVSNLGRLPTRQATENLTGHFGMSRHITCLQTPLGRDRSSAREQRP